MLILGIVNEEVSGACLVKNNEVVAAASEERYSRIKNDSSWPSRSIDYVLRQQGIKLSDVDHIAYGWGADFNSKKHLLMFFDRVVEEARNNYEQIETFRKRIEIEISRDEEVRGNFLQFVKQNGLKFKTIFFDHHECHAVSAFACSPFNSTLVLTADGRGDYQSFTVSVFDNHKHEVLHRSSTMYSLGFFYARITALLGFKVNRHEGKVTGLAAYGDPLKYLPLMEKMISYKDGRFISHVGPFYRPWMHNAVFSDELIKIISGAKREDIAAAAQRHLENLVTGITEHYLKKTGLTHVCMAGGVFANVSLNKKILDIPQVNNVFIQPHMSDGGLALGAAVAAAFQLTGQKVQIDTMFLGPEFNDQEIELCLANNEFNIKKLPDDEHKIRSAIDAIKDNKVVGWFQGRMEHGPRALCHRSILYHSKDTSVNKWLNKRMQRTEFMPFAPVTAVEFAERCYKNWRPDHVSSYYMTITYDCTEEMMRNSPAVVHIDGTARPQIVSDRSEPAIHKLLLKWHEETGGLSLVNTSFNKHEEPIVCLPSDALKALKEDMVDVLIIGSFEVKRRD
ncbi:MAG: carbamoyl transferase [Nitrospirae bacterium]|nr:carbamoyl transferase [Nitrospirota bacterium]